MVSYSFCQRMSRSSANAGTGSARPPSASLQRKKKSSATQKGKAELERQWEAFNWQPQLPMNLKKHTNSTSSSNACLKESTFHCVRQTVLRMFSFKPLSCKGSLLSQQTKACVGFAKANWRMMNDISACVRELCAITLVTLATQQSGPSDTPPGLLDKLATFKF